MASSNVQDEIKLAIDEKIDVVPIYFEEITLPPGLRLRLSNKHAIFKYSLGDEDYINDCFKAFKKAKIPKIKENVKCFTDKISETDIEHGDIYDVFIAYSQNDSEIANAVCDVLEKNDISCWIEPRNLKTSSGYAEETYGAIEHSKMALCIFSRNAQESSYVKNEISIAFSNNKKILSFKIDDFEPRHKREFFLKNNQWVIGCPNPENHLNEVVGAVKSILGIEEDMKKDTSLTEDDLPSIDKDIAQNKKGLSLL